MTPMRFVRFLLALMLVFCAAGVVAQESRATISGSVLDPSGAAIPGATVTAVETRTGVKTPTKSDATGNFNLPYLPPGLYTLGAEAAGFKGYERRGITLAGGDHPVLDIKLQMGQASEAVTVTEDAPIIETANSSTGQSLTTKQVEDMPLNGRNPMMVAQLAIGVIATGQPGLVHPFDNAAASAWSIGGTPSQNAEILMDGAPNGTWDNRMAYAPPQDAVQEVRVKAFDSDASYGHTQSGTINKVMKTGTNDLHGSAYFFGQPSVLAANDYFNKRKGITPQDTKLNQYGFTAGGPVEIPKVFNGRNKLFWFLGMEKLTDSQPNSKFLTVPTSAEQSGDFSAIPSLQLYNPYTGKLSGSTLTRAPFYCDASGSPIAPNMTPGASFGTQAVGTACNKIPSQLLSPVALAYLKLYPQSNTAGNSLGQSNYANSITTDDAYNNQLGRLDYNMSDRSRLSGNVRHNVQIQQKNNYFGNNTTGSKLKRENWGATIDEVYTLTNSTVLDVRANYSRFGEGHPSPNAGFDPTTLGFPSYVASSSQYLLLPAISFVGNKGKCASDTTQATSFDCFGDTGANLIPSTSYQLYGNVTKQWRAHTFKFGVDSRKYILDAQSYGAATGAYTFDNSWTNNAGSNSKAVNTFGQDLAGFLLGLPSTATYDLNARGTYHSYYYALFVQDDWRITRNLTINLGIRYDHDTPYSEKGGRTVNGFDTTDANPIAAAAIAAYAKSPVAQIPAGSFAVPGGLTFASAGDGSIWQNNSHMVSPRIGFAWSPEMFEGKTVIRGGFGIFVQPLSMAALNPVGKYSSTPILTQQGFSQTTQAPIAASFVSPDSTTTATLANPFPNGFLQPAGNTA
ncbi:MAG: TonB-dependent receptor domain-containing protein, partial [Terriglobales bacterium]